MHAIFRWTRESGCALYAWANISGVACSTFYKTWRWLHFFTLSFQFPPNPHVWSQTCIQLILPPCHTGWSQRRTNGLEYRYWSRISTAEDCGHAVEWYKAAADKGKWMFISKFPKFSQVIQAMSTFLSGLPGGRTLPLTPMWPSDLDGGVFGLGASVTSTSMNVLRQWFLGPHWSLLLIRWDGWGHCIREMLIFWYLCSRSGLGGGCFMRTRWNISARVFLFKLRPGM